MPTFLAIRGPFDQNERTDGFVHVGSVVSVQIGPVAESKNYPAQTALLISFEVQGEASIASTDEMLPVFEESH
jgi:hypothetical protein